MLEPYLFGWFTLHANQKSHAHSVSFIPGITVLSRALKFTINSALKEKRGLYPRYWFILAVIVSLEELYVVSFAGVVGPQE